MDSQGGFIAWILGGAGVLFLYAAYSKQHPAAVLSKTLGAAAVPAPLPRESASGGPVPGSAGTGRESADGGPIPGSRNAPAGTVTRGGLAYIVDGAGNPVGVVPDPYQGSSKTYIPGTVYA